MVASPVSEDSRRVQNFPGGPSAASAICFVYPATFPFFLFIGIPRQPFRLLIRPFFCRLYARGGNFGDVPPQRNWVLPVFVSEKFSGVGRIPPSFGSLECGYCEIRDLPFRVVDFEIPRSGRLG